MRLHSLALLLAAAALGPISHAIEPCAENPWYWQHDWGDGIGPVMLLGASGDDNPSQWAGARFEQALIEKLDLLDGHYYNCIRPAGHAAWNACPFWAVPPLYDDPVVGPFIESRYKRILDLTLHYDHVLYYLKNESCCPVEISDWWCDFIHNYAASKGKRIYLTENRWLHDGGRTGTAPRTAFGTCGTWK